jgi:hexosaminidase
MPSQVTISVSIDGVNYKQLKCIDNEVVRDDAVTFKTFGWNGKVTARYIRYQAQRSHHGGFLFVDEVVVR